VAGDELIRVADNATGVLGFSCGVIEAMAHRANLGNDDSLEALRRYLSKVFAGDAAQVEKALLAIRNIPNDPK
jgi:malonyl CoA-acyl carrier protein transacylase